MTREELEKACEERTWLLCSAYLVSGPFLVRVTGVAANGSWCFARGQDGGLYDPSFEELHIATPNHMLKYGE